VILLNVAREGYTSSIADVSSGHEKDEVKTTSAKKNNSEIAIRWCCNLKVKSSRDKTRAISLIEKRKGDKTFNR